jgi:catechol 2,3-dioxygenase-like lactoylglutathione lyase family enzyme
MGIHHIGIPTEDIQKTIDFYGRLGFVIDLQTVNSDGAPTCFLKLKNLLIETYQLPHTKKISGAIDHFAIEVNDVDRAFVELKNDGFTLLCDEIQFLQYWENGVRFFTVQGPNLEIIGFFQVLGA